MKSVLNLVHFEVDTYIGWGEKERSEKQVLRFDVSVGFTHPPKAIESDLLQDTLDYEKLCDCIRTHCTESKARLIENLAANLYRVLLEFLPAESTLWLKTTKISPLLEGLKEGASFELGFRP